MNEYTGVTDVVIIDDVDQFADTRVDLGCGDDNPYAK